MRAANSLIEVWDGFLDLVYPPKCSVCGALGPNSLCEDCNSGFEPVDSPICSRCGSTMRFDSCQGCPSGVPEHLVRARGAGKFQGPLRGAILKLKYSRRRRLAGPLGRYLADFVESCPFGSIQFDAIIPVPLHASRLRDREFNQAELLARASAGRLGIPVDSASLIRIRRTRPQVELGRKERAVNVRGAFRVVNPQGVSGKTILVVDDVVTTLSTSDECARVLLESGASAVFVASCARDVGAD